MSEPFIGEIRMFAGNYAPIGWALCDGQLLIIRQNSALFSLLGAIYGGDGRVTFALPDIQGRIPVEQGEGAGLTNRTLGVKGGSETETLTVNQIPSHGHDFFASTADATTNNPSGNVLATGVDGASVAFQYIIRSQDTDLASSAIANTGGSRSHTNMMPTLCLNFIIALTGVMPSRN